MTSSRVVAPVIPKGAIGRLAENFLYYHNLPETSFSGADVRVSAYISPDKMRDPNKRSSSKGRLGYFKTFAELQTITISSHRGVTPVRALGESWVREFTRGTRTIGGSLVFSVLDRDVFSELYSVARQEGSSYLPTFVDMLPPMTITIQAVNERGRISTMALIDVVLLDKGMTLSIDDVLTESTFTYVAKWATPFMDATSQTVLNEVLEKDTGIVQKSILDLASKLPLIPG